MDQSEEDTGKVKNILESGERIFYYGRTASCRKGAGGVVWQGEVLAFWEAVRDILRDSGGEVSGGERREHCESSRELWGRGFS